MEADKFQALNHGCTLHAGRAPPGFHNSGAACFVRSSERHLDRVLSRIAFALHVSVCES